MFRDNVLIGPLIALFETDAPIILNAKQLKNFEKKERSSAYVPELGSGNPKDFCKKSESV